MNILVVVDMQNDFVTGSLGTKEAQAIVPKVVQKVSLFSGYVIFTQDTHKTDYLETYEGKHLPVEHCIQRTQGWEIIDELQYFTTMYPRMIKDTFGSISLVNYLNNDLRDRSIESIELIGLCTDICVVSNALLLKAYYPNIPIIVDASCCAGTTPEMHEKALDVMRSCQIEVIADV